MAQDSSVFDQGSLPAGVAAQLAGYSFERISLGESGAVVWRCSKSLAPSCFLKTASLDAELRLGDEAERLRWMRARHLTVPEVCDYVRADNDEYLLLDEVPGVAASDPQWLSRIEDVVSALGAGLALLHRTGTADCPFDHGLARQLEEAWVRVAENRVDEEDFHESRAGRRATDLFAELLATVPGQESAVFTHGDFSLPNVILREAPGGGVEISGFIDCGRSGIADPYQDLALAIRDVGDHFGYEWVTPLLRAYGLTDVNRERVDFYTLLDEFF
jgi:aminoglycoside 3'-phosphotransferase-2